jgi:glycosyltransferase involved in cell wall biosynthesis
MPSKHNKNSKNNKNKNKTSSTTTTMMNGTVVNTQDLPFVSVCTPTFNRRPFISSMFKCFHNQDYPKSRIEWIIIDDGTDKIEDLIEAENIPQIRYFTVNEKMSLGAKRNFMHSKTKGSILVYMDDDDYYPPERISHAVERLQSKPEALCAGSSEIYVYFKHIQKMYQGGPYGPNHSTAGTFAFRRALLDQTQYEDHAALAEEKHFLKNYTIPFVQLDPMKTILVFSHIQNTFDKKKLLENKTALFVESPKTVDMFIRNSYESDIKQYFMQDIDKALETYAPGDPSKKPDVLVQMKELEAKRAAMIEEAKRRGLGNTQVIMKNADGTERALNQNEITALLQKCQDELKVKNEMVNRLKKELDICKATIDQFRQQNAKQSISSVPTSLTSDATIGYDIPTNTWTSILIPEVYEQW